MQSERGRVLILPNSSVECIVENCSKRKRFVVKSERIALYGCQMTESRVLAGGIESFGCCHIIDHQTIDRNSIKFGDSLTAVKKVTNLINRRAQLNFNLQECGGTETLFCFYRSSRRFCYSVQFLLCKCFSLVSNSA